MQYIVEKKVAFFKAFILLFTLILISCGGGGTEEGGGTDPNTNPPPKPSADTTAPVITLNGSNPMTIDLGQQYQEPNATAKDDRDGNVDVQISGTIDVNTASEYIVTYTATDKAGNQSKKERIVKVVETVQNSLGQTEIRPTHNNANSIITLIKDDGFWQTTPLFCDMLKRNNIKGKISEAFITGGVSAQRWNDWKGLYATGCLDILNHTATHPDLTLVPPTQLEEEINGAQETLEKVFSVKVITAVLPMAKRNDVVEQKVKERHWSMKGGWQFTGYNSLSPTEQEWFRLFQKQTTKTRTLAEMKQWLDDVVGKNKFLVISTHSCGFNNPGWGNVPCEYWEEFFKYLATNFDAKDYWFTGTATATRYIRERQNATINILSSTNQKVMLSLTDTLPDNIFDYPLLLKTVVPNTWQGVEVTQNAQTTTVSAAIETDGKNYVYFHAIPDRGNISLIARAGADVTPPVITVKGENPVNLIQGDIYTDAGADAFDNRDGKIVVNTTGENIDTNVLGEHTVTYSATDSSGNTSSATRRVIVVQAGLTAKPFPQAKSYAMLNKPSHKTQQQLNEDLIAHYALWKQGYLRESVNKTPGGGWFVRMNPAPRDASQECAPIRSTTSEAHGYGMIIMALMAGHEKNAKKYFDGMYNIYDQHRSSINSNLMAWCLEASEDKKFDTDSATDGDMDIAYSLLLAHEQWGSTGLIDYLAEAKRIITKGLKVSVMGPDDRIILGDWWVSNKTKWQYATRSSDWMPGHLRAYAAVTNDTYWLKAVDKIYWIVDSIRSNAAKNTGLMPDFAVGKNTPVPATGKLLESTTDGEFSWNACRYPLRIAFDVAHFNDTRARGALTQLTQWVKSKTASNPSAIKAGYTLSGDPLVTYSSMSFTAPMIAAAAVAEGNHQTFINKGWDKMTAFTVNDETKYYSNTIKLLSMLLISGNWWEPMQSSQ